MGTFDDPIGAILIATWCSSFLELLIIKGTIEYFINYPKDSLFKKIFIGTVVVVDFASLVAAYASVYLVTVTYWGNLAALETQPPSIPLCLIATGVVTVCVQGFLVYRVRILTRNWLVTIGLSLCAFAAFASITAAAAFLALFPLYSERYRGRIAVITWLTTTTATDLGITLVLIIWLYNMKTSFKHTESIIHRLIRVSIQTGFTTCVLALTVLISYIIDNSSNIEAGVTFVLSRSYVLTLLYNVNVRSTNHETPVPTAQSIGDPERHTTPGVALGEIQIHRTAHVHIDEAYPLENTKKTISFQDNDLESDQGYFGKG